MLITEPTTMDKITHYMFISVAIAFAKAAHAGQKRKYTGEPYHSHVLSVHRILLDLYPEATLQMEAAALLHDVVEDTAVTIELVEESFNEEVARLVSWLTDVSTPEDGNRQRRKDLDRRHIELAPAEAQIVKCADVIDNTASIAEHDPSFAKVYLNEVEALLHSMRPTVKDTEIWKFAIYQINRVKDVAA